MTLIVRKSVRIPKKTVASLMVLENWTLNPLVHKLTSVFERALNIRVL